MKKLFSEIPCLKREGLVLRKITPADENGLRELVSSEAVYRYLPTFLFEKKYSDLSRVISRLYDECFRESIILGVFTEGEFCGLAEMYGYREEYRKISVGYRFSERFWGRGIASETLSIMLDYLRGETDTKIITASTMVENTASARVLRKNGFELMAHGVEEDWGFEKPAVVDKWIR